MVGRFRKVISATVVASLLGLFVVPGTADAATVTVSVGDGSAPLGGAFVVAVNATSGAAIDAAITDNNGSVTLDIGDVAQAQVRISASRQGYASSSVNGAAASNSITLKTSQNNALKFANVFGAQTRTVVADAEPGVYYALTDGSPTVWRTVDYAGTWAAVPTQADASNGIAQGQAIRAAVSGYPGEIAVTLQGKGLWYSRDYGTTWSSLAVTGDFENVWWAHAGTSSYLFTKSAGTMKAAIMSAAQPTLQDWTLPSGMNQTDLFGVATGAQSSNQVFAASLAQNGTSSAVVHKLSSGATSVTGLTVQGTVSTSGLTAEGGNTQDLLMISTLGGANIAAVVVYDKSGQGNNLGGSTGSLRLGYSADGSTFTYGNGSLAWASVPGGANYENFNGWGSTSTVGIGCGENETPPVGSIAPLSPTGAGYSAFKLVGTVRQCMFALNTSGATANWGGAVAAPVAAGQTALLPMQGVNNNTGFAFDGGFDFSTNLVAISGDGQFGLRKSANFDPVGLRPRFTQTAVQGGADEFVLHQAKPGKGADSGGIAVNGIVSPAVQDITMSPNSTDGSTYLVSTGISGGSRTLLTTDGGKSFSTVNTAGATKTAWWNGSGSRQWIVGSAPLNSSRLLRAKNFTNERGSGATQMGDELAATAAQRDSAIDSSLRFTTTDSPLAPAGAQCFGVDQFFATGQQCNNGLDFSNGRIDLTAAAGVTGTDMVLLGVSKGDSERGQTTSGTVALLTLTAEQDSGGTVASQRYFGTAVDPGGTTTNATAGFGVGATTTYTGRVRAITYCPVGSAPKVADKAFVSVENQGMFVISGITAGNPQHAATSTKSTLTDLKVDCDTGILMAGSTTNGLQVSFDGDRFAAVRTGGLPSDPKVVDFQASKDTGAVTVVMGTAGQSVVQWDTTIPKMGATTSALDSGNVSTPASVPAAATEVLTLNDGAKGRQIGRIEDVELPAAAGDPGVKSASVGAVGVGAQGLSSFAASDNVAQIGSSTGSYVSSSTLARQNLAALTAGAGTSPAKSKVSTVRRGKSISFAAAVKKAGRSIPAGATVVISQSAASKKLCTVLKKKTIKGLKKGACVLTVRITPKKTKKVPKPKTTSVRVQVNVT